MTNRPPLFVFKYGGNAMTDDAVKTGVVQSIIRLHRKGLRVVIVHGGGPYIKKSLAKAAIASEFVDGQRKTTAEAMDVVEETLKGQVNAELVGCFIRRGGRAVGLSGKDGQTVIAKKRVHVSRRNGAETEVDLGRVGDVSATEPALLHLLIDHGYIPVMTCVAADVNGDSYNINGDIFAGHVAGALQADRLVVLTDVDGLLRDIDRPESLISRVSRNEIERLKAEGIIAGGMIPKTDACLTALEAGTLTAQIMNGTKPECIESLLNGSAAGTLIEK